jgi:hypothetical protein
MGNPFDAFDFEKANEVFTTLKTTLNGRATNRKFVQGDDWQGGDGWVGPQFNDGGTISKELRQAIEREFTSKSSIKAAVRRHMRGVIGRMPTWTITSRNAPGEPTEATPQEKTLIKEAEKILNELWKNSRVHQTLKDFVTDYLSEGHSILRLFFVQGAGEGPATTIEDAIKRIHIFRELPETGAVAVDRATLKRASFYRYERDGWTYIEMCYVNDAGRTVFKKFQKEGVKDYATNAGLTTLANYMGEGNGTQTPEWVELPLNEKLLVFAMTGEPFITAAMRSQQKLVNKAFTMMSHNLDVAGFRERILLNAMPPGTFKDNGSGNTVFVPDEKGLEVGPGVLSYVQGLQQTEREEGKVTTSHLTPGVFESDPIPITTYVDTAEAASAAILEEADQKHIMISGDATTSGESRKEAREGYKGSLSDTKAPFDDVVSELFETVLAVVAYLMEAEDRYKGLQVTFNAILNPGPISPDDRRIAIEECKEHLRSRQSAMEEAGITDPDAMKAKIIQEVEEMKAILPDPVIPDDHPLEN